MRKLTTLLLLCAFAAIANATPVTLSNAEASRLFVALRTTQAGLSAANTRNAALNINVLRPYIEALEAGQQVIQSKAVKLAKDPDVEAKTAALREEAAALAKQQVKVDLVPFAITDDELRDAKVPPDTLAEFLRFLAAPPPKK